MKRIVLYILLVCASAGCKEKFTLPYTGPASGYLVVDGVINSGQGPTTVRLNRTVALVDSVNIRYERNAQVQVEGEDNSVYPLGEISPGVYTAPQLNLADGVKYRLRIRTNDGKVYVSEYQLPKRTPDIDSIEWERIPGGVEFFVNTHDPQNNTVYYRWEYEETWEFHSPYYSMLQFVPDGAGGVSTVEPRDMLSRDLMYKCWQSDYSRNILIGSSARLSRDTIHLPLYQIPEPSWKISVLYSVLMRQYAVSRQG